MIHWKSVDEYAEPNWVKDGTALPPWLFWRTKKGAVLGYLRDGELFGLKWVYVRRQQGDALFRGERARQQCR